MSTEQAKLRALFFQAIDWGRSYGQRLNISDTALNDAAEGFADMAGVATPSEPMAAIDAGGGYPELPEPDYRRVGVDAQGRYGEVVPITISGVSAWCEQKVRAFADATAALRAGQVAAQPSETSIRRLQDAIEGECDGLVVADDTVRDILRYVSGMVPVQSCCGRRECGGECGSEGETEWVADPATPSPVAPVQAAQADDEAESLLWVLAVLRDVQSEPDRTLQHRPDRAKCVRKAIETLDEILERRAALSAPPIESKGVPCPLGMDIRGSSMFCSAGCCNTCLADRAASIESKGVREDGKGEAMAGDCLQKALRRAYQLGQTYWQQADSEYTSHHRKADVTRANFETLCSKTLAECAHLAMAPGKDEVLALNGKLRRQEADISQLMKDRDFAQKHADRLAEAIAEYFEVDIGEHSNMNCPWSEAFDAVPDRAQRPAKGESKTMPYPELPPRVGRGIASHLFTKEEMRAYVDADRAQGPTSPAAPITAVPAGEGARNKALECLGFFASVIKSGESWSATCQRMYDEAKTAGVPGVVQPPADAVEPGHGPITEAPERGARVWYFDALGRIGNHKWAGGPLDLLRLRDRRIFAAEVDAIAALQATKEGGAA